MILKVNGVVLPTPSKDSYKVSKNKIWSQNAGRTITGKMVGDLIAMKYKIEASWSHLTASDAKKIDNAVNTKKSYFSVTFYDPCSDKNVTKTMYAGDCSVPVYTTSKGMVTSQVSISLIEK